MGMLYGRIVRTITALSGLVWVIGRTACQFQISATILQIIFGADNATMVIFSAAIVIFYSAFGGIRAITYTDLLQLFVFGLLIPILSIRVWYFVQSDSSALVSETLKLPIFSFDSFVNGTWTFADWRLLVPFALLIFNPSTFQRMLMARNARQIQKSFSYAACIYLLIYLLVAWLGVLLLTHTPDLTKGGLQSQLISMLSPVLKGIMAICVMALIMSTTDSQINVGAVFVAHDLGSLFSIKEERKMYVARISILIIGVLSVYVALELKGKDLGNFLIYICNFYTPIISVPLGMAMLGFRTKSLPVIIGMAAGILTTLSIKKASLLPAIVVKFNFYCY